MKNSLIHSGLENSILRDFLSISICKNYQQEFENKKEIAKYSSEDSFGYAIQDCENEIKFHSKRLQILKERQAIVEIIKMQGWDEFDISEYTEKDLDYSLWMSFIGTESEHEQFLTSRIMLSRENCKAEKGKFRVISVDTFDGTNWIEGDFDTPGEAFKVANEKCGCMLKTHVYDDEGNHLHDVGSF